MPLRTRRWNDPPAPDDGFRLLVTRFRPRGVAAARETWDGWMRELAPPGELVKAFHAGEVPWDEYRRLYLAGLARERYRLDGLAGQLRAGDTLTLLCSSACTDPARCHRTLLAEVLTALAEGRTPPTS